MIGINNREIKFRGYDTDSKCWRYGYYFLKKDITLCPIYSNDEKREKDKKENEHHLILWNGSSDWNMPVPHYQSEVDGDSVGQYTGTTDKNKKEIYDGDIIRYCEKWVLQTHEFIADVSWDDELCTWIATNQFGSNFILGTVLRKGIEIIGNVYENPELLKEKE